MTGLDFQKDSLMEVACAVTDSRFTILGEVCRFLYQLSDSFWRVSTEKSLKPVTMSRKNFYKNQIF